MYKVKRKLRATLPSHAPPGRAGAGRGAWGPDGGRPGSIGHAPSWRGKQFRRRAKEALNKRPGSYLEGLLDASAQVERGICCRPKVPATEWGGGLGGAGAPTTALSRHVFCK